MYFGSLLASSQTWLKELDPSHILAVFSILNNESLIVGLA
tara:strand:+ start:380 stop:499 length:120 start_codon:yes stop_codon:yes gene_type:complete